MNQKQLDQIAEIKRLAGIANSTQAAYELDKIYDICEQIELDHKAEERLQKSGE